jgi:preprotein translocase subunit SecG
MFLSQTLIIIAIIVCALLGFFILIQNPKGGGLSSGFAGSNTIMGVQRTGDFLEKATWSLVVILMVLALIINVSVPRGGEVNNQNELLQQQINKPPAKSSPLSLPPVQDTTKK